MYQVGELLVYRTDGVCRLEAIGFPDTPYTEKGKAYYFLRPLAHGGMIYIPVDTQVPMRRVISREMALTLIDQIPKIKVSDTSDLTLNEMTEFYRASLAQGSCEDLVQLIKTAYFNKKTAASMGRKPGKLDTQAMSRAEDLLYEELSVALGIPIEDVGPLIEKRATELEHSDSLQSRW